MDQVGSAWLPGYHQISETYTVLVDSDLVGYLANFDFENTLKGWIKLDLLGYLDTIKFWTHILSLADSDLVGYLATFDFEKTLKRWIKLDLLCYLATINFLRHILFLVDSDLVGYLATFDFENTLKG